MAARNKVLLVGGDIQGGDDIAVLQQRRHLLFFCVLPHLYRLVAAAGQNRPIVLSQGELVDGQLVSAQHAQDLCRLSRPNDDGRLAAAGHQVLFICADLYIPNLVLVPNKLAVHVAPLPVPPQNAVVVAGGIKKIPFLVYSQAGYASLVTL